MLDTITAPLYEFISRAIAGLNSALSSIVGGYLLLIVAGASVGLAYLLKRRYNMGFMMMMLLAVVLYGFFRFLGVGG